MGSERIRLALLGFVVAIVFASSFILVREGRLYISPDETANAVFAERVAQSGIPLFFDSYNLSFGDTLHPRSTVSLDGRLVPVGFMGLPVLFGLAAIVLGLWTIPLLLPCIAAVAVFAWYGIVKRLFDRDLAFVSALLLAIHPAWWYYTARTLMPNVLFVSLCLFAGWVLLARPVQFFLAHQKRRAVSVWVRYADVVVGGLCTGLALFVRPSEIIWLAVGALIVGWSYRQQFAWRPLALFALGCVVALLPMLALNQVLYGSPFTTGYRAQTEGEVVSVLPVTPTTITNSAPSWWINIQNVLSPLFPFGIHPRTAARHIGDYGLGMFWWMTLLAVLGIPLLLASRALSKETRLSRRTYAIATFTIALYLGVMYGSWVFYDNPDPERVTIANSYVRYGLPFFVLMTPFAAASLLWVVRRAMTPFAQRLALTILFLLCASLSVRTVFFSPDDGLVRAAEILRNSIVIREQVFLLTEPESVIIVDRADKLFWPERHVRYPLRSEETYQLMPEIALRVPLYYYGITFPERDMTYLNEERLPPLGLQIILVETFGEESLYRIYPSHP